MSGDTGSSGVYGAFASKLGSHAAKAGKKIAQSEAGRSAGRAAVKGATDAAAKDLSNRYFGGYEDTPTPPPAATVMSQNKGGAKKPAGGVTADQRPPSLQQRRHVDHHDNDDDDDEVFERHQEMMKKSNPPPPKPSIFNRFKPSINTKPKSSDQSNSRNRTQPGTNRKHTLDKTADWDILPRAIALYNYRAEMRCDLEFRKGQVIEVLTRTDSQFDWWEGKIEERVGIFPANYVKMVS